MIRKLALVLAVVGLLALPAVALADGDPASDVLYSQQVFFPYGANPKSAAAQKLKSTVAAANRGGLKIRVALIATRYDLGAVPDFLGRPQYYARFLGGELYSVYAGLVLAVMPTGAGIGRGYHPAPDLQRIVGAVPREPGIDGLARMATAAVERLAAATGHRLVAAPPQATSKTTRHRGNGLTIALVLAGLGCVVLIALLGVIRVARRLRAQPGGAPPGDGRPV